MLKKILNQPIFTAFIIGMLLLSACSQASAPPATDIPAATGVPAPTQDTGAAIEHKSIPGEPPAERSTQGGDQDASIKASKHIVTDGDKFSQGRLERPFNANTMDTYFPQLDIQELNIFEDNDWTYANIALKGVDGDGKLSGIYGIEIDLDQDGRGDWLILASSPSMTVWSTDGVQVWQDTNDDVGNKNVIQSDPPQTGDGYDLQVFDGGKGDDPDIAWARISPQDANSVQITFKKALLKGDTSYLVGAWAGSDLNPAWFDLNDRFTHEQAGAADPGYELYYPIKELAEIDNTCRIPVGFASSGNEPGVCTTLQPSGGALPPPVAAPRGGAAAPNPP